MSKTEEQRVPMNISLTQEDKKFLKLYAIEHDTNVSTLIEEWIQTLKSKEDK